MQAPDFFPLARKQAHRRKPIPVSMRRKALEAQPPAPPNLAIPQNAFLALQGAVNEESQELAQAEEGKEGDFFPTMAVVAALNAVDFLMPENLAERALKIATMALNGARIEDISRELDIHPKVVEAELNRISASRSMALKADPALGAKVLEATFDNVKCSEDLITQSMDVLAILKETINAEWQSAQKDREEYNNQPSGPGGRDHKKYPRGVSPFVVQAFWQGLDTIGRHQDRIENILNPMSKKVLDPRFQEQGNTTIQTVINFHSQVLNDAANKLMEAAGQIPVAHARPMLPDAKQKEIEVQARAMED